MFQEQVLFDPEQRWKNGYIYKESYRKEIIIKSCKKGY